MENKNILQKTTDKLFGGLKMSWLTVILYAVGTALLTAIILMTPIFSDTAIHRVGETPEAWILFAVIIMANCKKPLESALKTFAFFLISQPLIYLFQVPFNMMGWQLFGYYRYWFIVTLFTFPVAFIGWFITKKNWLSVLIFAPVFVLLVWIGYGAIENPFSTFVQNLLIFLFCVFQILLYTYVFLPTVWQRLAGIAVPVAAVGLYMIFGPGEMITEAYIQLPDGLDLSKYAVVELADTELADVEVASIEADTLHIKSNKPGSSELTVKDSGRTYRYTLEISKQNNAVSIEILQNRTADLVIEELITYHGSYDKKADTKVKELLSELDKIDSKQGKLWKNIMDYWDYANNELKVNIGSLPKDLPKDDSLALVVLGFELNDNGTMKDELIGRLKVALACSKQYPKAYVVCTGGGTAKNNDRVTEADLMGEWLVKHGLKKNRLIIENKSLTTAHNAEFSYNIINKKYPQINSVAIISSSYHIAWGSLLFEAEFMKYSLENNVPEIHVVSNAAYKTSNETYKESEILRWQTGGMLQLIGNDSLAMDYYYNRYEKPTL